MLLIEKKVLLNQEAGNYFLKSKIIVSFKNHKIIETFR